MGAAVPNSRYFLNRGAQTLVAIGRTGDARRDSTRAINLLPGATGRTGAGGDAWNEYAWALVSYGPEDVRNPRVALAYAHEALERAGSPTFQAPSTPWNGRSPPSLLRRPDPPSGCANRARPIWLRSDDPSPADHLPAAVPAPVSHSCLQYRLLQQEAVMTLRPINRRDS